MIRCAALGPRRPGLRPEGGDVWGSMPLDLPGLMVGRPLRFLSRAIASRWAATVRSNSATRPNSSSTNRFRSAFDRPSRSGAGDMQGIESELSLRRNPDPAAQPGLLPMLLVIPPSNSPDLLKLTMPCRPTTNYALQG